MVNRGRTIFRVREPHQLLNVISGRPAPAYKYQVAHAAGIFAMCSCMEERSPVALSPAKGTTDARNITWGFCAV